ncbi:MAG: hypothetical protein AABZ44_07970, partial [Elusimicrobiota bacterium]
GIAQEIGKSEDDTAALIKSGIFALSHAHLTRAPLTGKVDMETLIEQLMGLVFGSGKAGQSLVSLGVLLQRKAAGGLDDLPKQLKASEDMVAQLLSDTMAPAEMSKELVGNLARYLGITQEAVAAAVQTALKQKPWATRSAGGNSHIDWDKLKTDILRSRPS